ncbi:hypothetical protein HYQ46_005081 [Verticillium longisporum]|nr:hypothetical protein HYQ46_005081 [Verticillium longisporum]
MRVIHRSCISRMRRDLHYSSAFLGANGSKRTAEPLTFVSRPSSRRTHPTQNATTRIGHTGPGPSGYDTADAIFKARKYPLLAAGVVALGCGVDISADMLGVAIDKLPKAVPGMIEMTPTVSARTTSSGGGWREFAYLGGKIRVAHVSDPEKVLSNLASAVKLGTGRIILVEHGRGWWRLVNTLLDWSALAHYRKIVRLERPFITQLGTTVWIELAVDSPNGSEPSHDP